MTASVRNRKIFHYESVPGMENQPVLVTKNERFYREMLRGKLLRLVPGWPAVHRGWVVLSI